MVPNESTRFAHPIRGVLLSVANEPSTVWSQLRWGHFDPRVVEACTTGNHIHVIGT